MRRKEFDLVDHPECDHHWVHNAGEQCEWDRKGIIGNRKADSRRIVYFYICTRCGGEFWSQRKEFDIPYYRVKEA